MRRRYGGGYRTPRTPKAKKIRPLVVVRDKTAKRGGRCAGCKMRYEVGDNVTVVRVRRRTYHQGACVPVNPAAAFAPAAPGATPGAAPMPETQPAEAALAALLSLENALKVKARSFTKAQFEAVAPAFKKYKAFKEHVVRNQNDTEQKQALKLATIELVKLIYGTI